MSSLGGTCVSLGRVWGIGRGRGDSRADDDRGLFKEIRPSLMTDG